jgi:hypothetical protein
MIWLVIIAAIIIIIQHLKIRWLRDDIKNLRMCLWGKESLGILGDHLELASKVHREFEDV